MLVTFLYGGLIWQMLPYFTPSGVSWEGHLGGAIMGVVCSLLFSQYGPQRPEPFADDDDEESETEDTNSGNEDGIPENTQIEETNQSVL